MTPETRRTWLLTRSGSLVCFEHITTFGKNVDIAGKAYLFAVTTDGAEHWLAREDDERYSHKVTADTIDVLLHRLCVELPTIKLQCCAGIHTAWDLFENPFFPDYLGKMRKAEREQDKKLVIEAFKREQTKKKKAKKETPGG